MPAILSQSNVLTKQTANYLGNGKLKLHNNMDTDGCCCCSAILPDLVWFVAKHSNPELYTVLAGYFLKNSSFISLQRTQAAMEYYCESLHHKK